MSIIQTFYDSLATQYDKLFLDWQVTINEQAEILNEIFKNSGFDYTAKVLDCACGIGTQAIGIAKLGYHVTASDISKGELVEAEKEQVKTMLIYVLNKLIFVLCPIHLQINMTL